MILKINSNNLSQMVQASGPAPDELEIIIDDLLEDGWFIIDNNEPLYLGDIWPGFVEN